MAEPYLAVKTEQQVCKKKIRLVKDSSGNNLYFVYVFISTYLNFPFTQTFSKLSLVLKALFVIGMQLI